MTPEKAKALLPIITAFAEGKTVETKTMNGRWRIVNDPSFNLESDRYRIKSEPRYEPYTPDQLATLVGKPLKHKLTGSVWCVLSYSASRKIVGFDDGTYYTSERLLEYFTHLDDTPCGNLVV